jgi:hypothetical protein
VNGRLFRGYGDAPVDEVGLAWRAEDTVRRLQGRVPDTQDLKRIASEHGLDFATTVFYRGVLASPAHGEFVRLIDEYPAAPIARAAQSKLLVVPAMFYRERPDLGGGGELVATIARACGFRAEVIRTGSRGSISENASAIWEAIEKEERESHLWLFSLSKGGGEVRLALQSHPDDEVLGRIRGWINASGIVRGSHFIDYMLGTPAHRLRTRALCLAIGTSYAGIRELQTTHGYWQDDFRPPGSMTIINLVGVPLGSHVQKGLVGRYRRLGMLGPNDGFVLLPDTLIHPGLIYPIWGSDHLFRSPQVSPLLYRLFNLLRDCEEPTPESTGAAHDATDAEGSSRGSLRRLSSLLVPVL